MSYKKWIYKYKYLQAEFADVEEIRLGYTNEFNNIFHFKDKKETIIKTPEEEIYPKTPKNKKHPESKNLYKKLSKKTHPDKGGSEEEFKDLNTLYEKEDILGMIIKAEEYNIDVSDLKIDKPEEEFKELCTSIEDKIEFIKTTLAWKWAEASDEFKPTLLKIFEQTHGVVLKDK